MAKKSRRPARGDTPASRPADSTPAAEAVTPATEAATSTSATPPTSTTRAASTTTSTGKPSRRPRSRRVRQQTFFERYRSYIVGGAALGGFLLIAYVLFAGANTKAYSCDAKLTPGPVESLTPRPSVLATPTPAATGTPAPTGAPAASPAASGTPAASGSPAASGTPGASESPAASPTPEPTPTPDPTARLGFTTDILGRTHVQTGSTVEYGFCPPTSGNHYNAAGRGPIQPLFYQPNEARAPGGWIHNLEHGSVVLLYRCPSGVVGQGDCVTQAELDQMRAFYDTATANEVSVACPNKLLVARFDDMDTRFAEIAWGRALLTNDFDLDRAKTFDQQWREHDAAPELQPTVC